MNARPGAAPLPYVTRMEVTVEFADGSRSRLVVTGKQLRGELSTGYEPGQAQLGTRPLLAHLSRFFVAFRLTGPLVKLEEVEGDWMSPR